ncbi:MAG: DUF3990 domain-containing protein [Planctomycetaceae bacterium]|jgi:hypothetical protein|nr:DUF3990 domain-containing protein [Planctomycetaceae bacterium]
MKLYHGGMIAVEKPVLITPTSIDHTTDFGNGFYTTTDLKQAKRWVQIRRERYQTGGGVVSIFETDDNLLYDKELNCLVFKEANKNWLEFIMQNRSDKNYSHDYDIVFGPVANDRVYASLTLFENDFLDVAETIRRLKTYKLTNQILFHTEKSLQNLIYIGNEEIT